MQKLIKIWAVLLQILSILFYLGLIKSGVSYFTNDFSIDDGKIFSFFLIGSIALHAATQWTKNKYKIEYEQIGKMLHMPKKGYGLIALSVFILAIAIVVGIVFLTK